MVTFFNDGKMEGQAIRSSMRPCDSARVKVRAVELPFQQSPSAQCRFHAQSRKNDSGHVSNKGEHHRRKYLMWNNAHCTASNG
jgi:hypothetical protein